MVIYGWKTTKKKEGYEFNVHKIIPLKKPDKTGSYAKTTTVIKGIKPTRARASGLAKRYVRYYGQQKKVKL